MFIIRRHSNLYLKNVYNKSTVTAMSTMVDERIMTNAELLELLSDENKTRCLEKMRSSPPIGIRPGKSKIQQRQAAVLIALCINNQDNEGNQLAEDQVSILYTRRSPKLRTHVRQISFPGGILDETDADFVDCALRETEEEIGLSRKHIEIWGEAGLIKPPHTAAIMPVIGVVCDFKLSDLKINEDEVEEAFTIPLTQLISTGALHHTQFKTGYSSPVFMVGQYRIWGITGFLTNVFLNALLPHEMNNLTGRVKYIRPYKPAST